MKITAIILAGGKSSRMGTEKGLVKLDGKCMIEYVIDVVKNISKEIIIVTNTYEYRCFGYKVFPDIIKDCGPMGGIYTGLVHSKTKKNFILSCDMPFVKSEILKYLIENSGDYDITVPVHHGKTEPLCAVYDKNSVVHLKELLLKKEFKMRNAFKKFRVNEVDISNQEFYFEKVFRNINTKKEFYFANKIHQ